MKERKSKGHEAFKVPNTPEGQEFLKLARKFLHNTTHTIKVRGRGSRKEYAKVVGDYTASCGLALPYAKALAIYVKPRKLDVVCDWASIQQLRGENELLKFKLAKIKEQAYNIYNG